MEESRREIATVTARLPGIEKRQRVRASSRGGGDLGLGGAAARAQVKGAESGPASVCGCDLQLQGGDGGGG